jgi:hypothetical protein
MVRRRRKIVTRKRASGLCRLFRRRAIGRVAVQLCLFLMMANLIAPLAWATAQGGVASDGFVLCHVSPGSATSDRDLPADHQNDSVIPHCPLCLVFNGSVATPPSGAPEIVQTASFRGDAPLVADDARPHGQTLRLHPSPRAPPASA